MREQAPAKHTKIDDMLKHSEERLLAKRDDITDSCSFCLEDSQWSINTLTSKTLKIKSDRIGLFFQSITDQCQRSALSQEQLIDKGHP